ncbi:MAG: serine/threonine protein kinase, partial [Cyanobacteria bacterium J083]
VIHRDIKPQNIIRRTNDNKLVLIDFGIAKEQTLTSLTSIGKPPTIIGTVGYAPEEQIGHTKKGVTKSSDLYGVATTCFHLLTGVNPRDSWNKYGYSWVEHWREFLADSLDPNLELVLNKLLQRNLQLRYKTAEEVLRDLKSDIDSKVNISTQVLGSNPQRITAYNAPTKVIKPKTPPQQSSLASSKYSSAKPNILSKTPVKIYPFVTSTLRQVKIWLSGSLFLLIVVGTQLYGYLRYQVFPTNPIWLFNSPPTSFFLKNTLTGHTEWVNSVAISNNDKYVVSGSGDQSIKIWNLHSGTIYSTLRGHKGSVNAVAISPNNQLISSGSDDQTIKLWQLETGQLKNNLTGHSQAINSLAFTPD